MVFHKIISRLIQTNTYQAPTLFGLGILLSSEEEQ
jgi:hypothetical protein